MSFTFTLSALTSRHRWAQVEFSGTGHFLGMCRLCPTVQFSVRDCFMGRYGHVATFSPFCDSDDGSIRIVNVHDGVSVMNVKETSDKVRGTDCRRATVLTVVPACAT